MGKEFRNLVAWILAIVLAAGLLNCFAFCFYHPVHTFHRQGGANPDLAVPGQWGLYGLEGYGVQTIDKTGYVNADLPREADYFCVVGSSHAEGFNVPRNARFSDLLNQRFGCEQTLKFYNIADSGYYFEDIARRFPAITEEFPDAQGIIIEILSTSCTEDQLAEALDSLHFSPERDSMQAFQTDLTWKDRGIIALKNWAPFLRELTKQLETYRKNRQLSDNQQGSLPAGQGVSLLRYERALEPVLQGMRAGFDGPIIIVYHPTVRLLPDGSMEVDRAETDPAFAAACTRNGICFLNMENVFRQAYDAEHIVPYGFWNTTMTAGHLNQEGHRLVADVLYDCLTEMGIS